jgi:hypothetical protein
MNNDVTSEEDFILFMQVCEAVLETTDINAVDEREWDDDEA